MNHLRSWGPLSTSCLLAVFVSALPLVAQSSNTLKLGNATGEFGALVSVDLKLSTTDEVQGLVAAFDWDDTVATGEALEAGPAIADADVVVTRVESDFMILGVVMDNDGVGNEVILPGDDLLLGTAKLRCAPGTGTEPSTAAIEFRDDTYATVDGGPTLSNIVVVGGLSISTAEGLELVAGSVTCTPKPNKYSIGKPGGENPGTNGEGRTGSARVMLQNIGDVEGYVVALCHDSAVLTLEDIAVGDAANAVGAEFNAADMFADGGTIGVVLDFESPFDGQVLTPETSPNNIATYSYRCNDLPAAGEPPTMTPLTFCDNVLGSPLKENVIVIGGRSIGVEEGLVLEDGVFECRPVTGPPPTEDCNNGIDDDGDGLIDAEDPDCQQAFKCETHKGSVGGQVSVDLYLKTPEDNATGEAQFDHVQGFSMAISFCSGLELNDETLDISGTILEAIGAEFVSVQADNTTDDGDGHEAIVGVLVDALPPFDGATIPPMDDFQRMGTLTFDIKDDPALCNTVCDIEFKDGLNGRGKVPVKNLISVENVSRGVQTFACAVEIVGKPKFFRGDCNFSNMGGMSVDISDAAAVVSFLFMKGSWKFNPPCLDACDCNDDGRLDLADAICVLQYYLQGGRFPPPPGPGWMMNDAGGVTETGPGEDPTPDKLDCAGAVSCD